MKQVLSIQDLSCMGKCSLSVALPVLSAMGCACSVLPTAVLSTHTAFPGPHIRDLTEDIGSICRHWQSIGAGFNAITAGYLSSPEQAAAVEKVLDTFDAVKIIDPAMGDHGKLYSGLGSDHVDAMARLCRKANILLPNATEAAFLTGIPYRDTADRDYYRTLLDGLMAFGADTAVITGISLSPGTVGFMGFDKETGEFSFQTTQIPRQCHGTGDLFAAVFAGAFVRGQALRDAAALAANFAARVVSQTPEATPFGIEFEPQLPWLWEHI